MVYRDTRLWCAGSVTEQSVIVSGTGWPNRCADSAHDDGAEIGTDQPRNQHLPVPISCHAVVIAVLPWINWWRRRTSDDGSLNRVSTTQGGHRQVGVH